MAVAVAQGIFWPTVCHGLAECHTCFFEVIAGEERCEPPGRLEAVALRVRRPFVYGEGPSDWPVRPGSGTGDRPQARRVRPAS